MHENGCTNQTKCNLSSNTLKFVSRLHCTNTQSRGFHSLSPLTHHHNYCITFLLWYSYTSTLCILAFFSSLSYLDLSDCVTNEGTQSSDPHWWRVSKPFPEATEALLNYKPKQSWIKGVFKKNKGNFEAMWPLENLFTRFSGEFLVLESLISFCESPWDHC